MNTVQSLDEMLALAYNHVGVCLSIYMPTHRKGPDTQQNSIRFKNLLREAENQLVQSDLRPSEIRELLAPAQELLNNELFWRSQLEGFVLFLSPDSFHSFKTPVTLEERVVVSDRFHLKPLIGMMARDTNFLILAISQSNVRLFECTCWKNREVSLNGIPQSLTEALDLDDFEKRLQLHTGSENTKMKVLKFFQQVDRGLQDILRDRRDPLIFAGVEYLFPIYREANTYQYLLAGLIPGSPEGLTGDDLRRMALPLIGDILKAKERESLDLYRKSAGTGLASRDIREIVQAASHGREGTLFAARDIEQWGVYNSDTGDVVLSDPPAPSSWDLVDHAAINALFNGGTVYVLDSSEIPGGGSMAAVFRY